LAHSKAYHLAKSLGINGTISFKNSGGYKIPLTNSTEDSKAVERAWDFFEGWFANPVFINGDFPVVLKDFFGSFLPDFTDKEKHMINGTSDVFAHDAYTAEFYFGQHSFFLPLSTLLILAIFAKYNYLTSIN
jgi:beta-glucosidase